jgi:RNA polymerase sigma-70 factor (ECF subfamily)
VSDAPLNERTASAEEVELLARLRAGDERAFEALVHRHYGTMLAVARTYVSSRAVAEEVVQEAWLGVLKGLDRFEGRSSLATWIMRIVVNIAKTRGVREARSIPYASLVAGGCRSGCGTRAIPRRRRRLPRALEGLSGELEGRAGGGLART